jgi:hypothetical protein
MRDVNEFLYTLGTADLTVVGAVFATYLALVLRFVDCCNEADSEPSRAR